MPLEVDVQDLVVEPIVEDDGFRVRVFSKDTPINTNIIIDTDQ